MQNDFDLSHINKQLRNDEANLSALRREIDNKRAMANQRYREENPNGARYYEDEANRLEQNADALEDTIKQLTAKKGQFEQRIAQLQQQRTRVDRSHQDHLAEIDREITRLSGNGMML